MPPTLRLLLLLAALLLGGCAHSPFLANQNDYIDSRNALARDNVAEARAELPRKEYGGFIYRMERAYLDLLQGKADNDELAHYAAEIEKRLRFSASREARTFFYVRTPEDYYASEHEVIWLHMLLSWGYSMQGRRTAGCVEARKSANLLSLPWSEEGHFDDPTLRLFNASMFALCGSWDEARIDLRAAAELDPKLTWARKLADQSTPPTDLALVLGGIGPEPVWDPTLAANPLRGARQVRFRYPGRRSQLSLRDLSGLALTAHISPGSAPWYERHLIRDNAIHELVRDSRYGGAIAGQGLIATVRVGAATVGGIVVGTIGVAVGGAMVYAGLQGNSSDMMQLGFTVMGLGAITGYNMAKKEYLDAKRDFSRELNPAIQYRYVRFLPEYLWLAWSDSPLHYPLAARVPGSHTLELAPIVKSPVAVSIGHLADTAYFGP